MESILPLNISFDFKNRIITKSLWCSLFFILLFSNSSFAQNSLNQKIDFSVDNQTLEACLWQLSESTNIPIAFSNNLFSQKKYSFSFSQKSVRDVLNEILEESSTTFSFINGRILIFKKPPQKTTISGYIEDSSTGEQLIGANIYDLKTLQGTASNEYGFFSLTVSDKKTAFRISYLGYLPVDVDIEKLKKIPTQIKLKPNLTLREIIVINKPKTSFNTSTVLEKNFSFDKKITQLPSLGGEVDILRVMQQLPGVQSGTDGFGGLHVRGGNADQNLILLDGVPVYNPYHTLGLYSIFNHKIIRKVRYLRGQFPARFGGRISSVVDVRTKEGNNKSYHAQLSTGLIATKAAIEGPIIKDKGAFFISARRSHLDSFLKKYSTKKRIEEDEKGFYNYFFGDIIGKVNYSFSAKDKIYFSFYKGKDDYQNHKAFTETDNSSEWNFSNQQNLDWGNTLGAIRWNHQFGNKLFSNTTLTFSQFDFNSKEKSDNQYIDGTDSFFDYDYVLRSTFRSDIENLTAKFDLDYVPFSNHYFKAGISTIYHQFNHNIVNRRDSISFVLPDETLNNSSKIEAWEFNTYLEDEWQINPKLTLNAGFFGSLFFVENKNYLLIDPRFSINWQVTKPLTLYLSINKMSQNLHVLSRSGSGFPNDLWIPSTEKIKPQQAWMLDVGSKSDINPSWSLEVNGYYKKMNHLVSYLEGTNFALNSEVINANNWEDKTTSGKGTSKGLEFLLKKEKGKSTGWISYTLSESNRQFTEINNGEIFPFRFDLRHVLNIVFAHEFNEHWSLASTWNFSSGSNIDLALSQWQYIRQDGQPDFFYTYFGKKNSYQLPNYHRMDFSAKYNQSKKWGKWSIDLGVYNLYNRRNIYWIKPNFNPLSQSTGYTSISLIPILPYFSFNIEI